MQIYYLILYFFTYGFLGWCVEVGFATMKQRQFVNRGFLNGPICPIYGVGVSVVILLLEPYKENFILLYVASVIIVTLIEGITGYAMDKIFHHKWWDYSDQPMNIGGYVCLVFSLVWGVACVAIVKGIHPLIYKVLSFVPTMVGIIVIVIFMIALFADISVTAVSVLKLNRRLERLEKIATELQSLSNRVGASISDNVENVMETMENVEKREDVVELKRRYEELKSRYAEISDAGTRVSERLMKAFPKMESRQHRDILNELKEHIWIKRKKKD